jgi:hypothetical protein
MPRDPVPAFSLNTLPQVPEDWATREADLFAKKLRTHLIDQHGLKLKKREVLEALGAGLGYDCWDDAQDDLERLLGHLRQAAAQEAELFKVVEAEQAINADLDTLIVGGSGVGKTTALARAMMRELAGQHRPVLVLLDRSYARDTPWDELGEVLKAVHGSGFIRADSLEEVANEAAPAAIVGLEYLDKKQIALAKGRARQVMDWAKHFVYQGQRPVLVMDEPQTVFRDSLHVLLQGLVFGAKAIWATPVVSDIPEEFWYRFKKLVAMAAWHPEDRALERFVLEQRHPQPMKFAVQRGLIGPRQALTWTSPRC